MGLVGVVVDGGAAYAGRMARGEQVMTRAVRVIASRKGKSLLFLLWTTALRRDAMCRPPMGSWRIRCGAGRRRLLDDWRGMLMRDPLTPRRRSA